MKSNTRQLLTARWCALALAFVLGGTGKVEAQLRYEQTAAIGLSGVATGGSPHAKMLEGTNGVLYGTTRFEGSPFNRGSMFQVNKDGSGFRLLHIFGVLPGDGRLPTYDGIMFGTNGLIYGVTHLGGAFQRGAIFSIDLNGDNYQTVFSFTQSGHTPRGQLLVLDDGALLGATLGGYIYRINHDGSGFRVLHWAGTNGAGSGLAYNSGFIKGNDGWLYNMTEDGGIQNTNPVGSPWPTLGTVVRVRPDGSDYQILHQFQGSPFGDGSYPHGGLLMDLARSIGSDRMAANIKSYIVSRTATVMACSRVERWSSLHPV